MLQNHSGAVDCKNEVQLHGTRRNNTVSLSYEDLGSMDSSRSRHAEQVWFGGINHKEHDIQWNV